MYCSMYVPYIAISERKKNLSLRLKGSKESAIV